MDAVDGLGLEKAQEAQLRRLLFRGGWLIDGQALRCPPRARIGAMEVEFVDEHDGRIVVATQDGTTVPIADARAAESIFEALSAAAS